MDNQHQNHTYSGWRQCSNCSVQRQSPERHYTGNRLSELTLRMSELTLRLSELTYYWKNTNMLTFIELITSENETVITNVINVCK